MPEVMNILALTSEFIGTLLIGIAVLRVHTRVEREHRIDKRVLKAIHKERWLTKIGLLFIIIGFVLNFV
jgi:hypothetical protein